MATIVVSFDGARLSTADSSTAGGTWDKYGSTQTPIQEANFVLQGALEQSNKISNTTGGVQFVATSTVDFVTTPKTIIAKVQVSTVSSIDKTVARGMSYEIGSGSGDNYQYYLVGSGTGDDYPVNAGWLAVVIDPNVSAYRDNTVGTPALGSLDWVGLYADITALAKAENVIHSALDYVDNGAGLTMTGGDGADADGVFLDFVLEDEDTAAVAGIFDNRWRLAARSAGSDTVSDAIAVWTIGDTSATVFTDSNKVIKWAGGRVDSGFHGLNLELTNAGTVIGITSCTFISNGVKATNDSRADFNVLNTSGTATITGGAFVNFNAFTLTSAITLDAVSFVEPESLDQVSGTMIDCIFDSPTVATGTAFMSVNDITKATGASFTSSGTGYAITGFPTAASYTLTNIDFSGYAASDGSTGDEAIYVEATTGTVTLTITGGTTPSVRTAGATVVKVVGAVTTIVKAVTTSGVPIENARVLLRAADATGDFPFRETVTLTRSGSTVSAAHTAHGMANNDKVQIRQANEQEYNGVWTISNVTTNAYDYTIVGTPASPATGSIISTWVALEGLTDINGEIEMSRVISTDQPVTGWARKSSASPFYEQGGINDTIDNALGLSATAALILDE